MLVGLLYLLSIAGAATAGRFAWLVAGTSGALALVHLGLWRWAASEPRRALHAALWLFALFRGPAILADLLGFNILPLAFWLAIGLSLWKGYRTLVRLASER